jgi:hypothetical protein
MTIRAAGAVTWCVSASAWAASGWRALTLLILFAGAVLAMTARVIKDDQRTQRLALLLRRGRNEDGPPTA